MRTVIRENVRGEAGENQHHPSSPPSETIQNEFVIEPNFSFVALFPFDKEIFIRSTNGIISKISFSKVDLFDLLTKKQWDVCFLFAHGDYGHIDLLDLTLCAAVPSSTEEQTRKGTSGCISGEQCVRSKTPNDFHKGFVSLSQVNTNVLFAFTCGGLVDLDTSSSFNVSTIKHIESSSIQCWVTTWVTINLSAYDVFAALEMLMSGYDSSTIVWFLNDAYQRRFGLCPFVHQGRVSVVRSPAHKSVKLLAGSLDLSWDCISPKTEFNYLERGVKSILIDSLQSINDLEDASEIVSDWASSLQKKKVALEYVMYLMMAVEKDLKNYLLYKWQERKVVGFSFKKRKIKKIISIILHSLSEVSELEQLIAMIKKRGVVVSQHRIAFSRAESLFKQIDLLIARIVPGLDWETLVLPKGAMTIKSTDVNTRRCAISEQHPTVEFISESKVQQDNEICLVECGVCGVLSLSHPNHEIFLNKEEDCETAGAIKFSVHLPVVYVGGWITSHLVEHHTHRLIHFEISKIENKEYVLEIFLPDDIKPDAHFLEIFAVKDGRVSWCGRRIFTMNHAN